MEQQDTAEQCLRTGAEDTEAKHVWQMHDTGEGHAASRAHYATRKISKVKRALRTAARCP